MVGYTLPEIWLIQGCYMPSVAHPGNWNIVQQLWILYTPEIYCWTLIDTAQRSPSKNKLPSLNDQSSGLSDPSFHSMSSRCSVVALSTQWNPKHVTVLSYYKTFHKNTTKTFNKSFHKLSGNWKCKNWLSSSVKARPFLMRYQNEMFS